MYCWKIKYLIVILMMIPIFSLAQNQQMGKRTSKGKESGQTIVISGLNSAQEVCRRIGAKFDMPVINYEPLKPPKFWKNGMLTEMGFSQVSLTNWAAGGSGSVAMNAHVNAHANYEKGGMFWENRIQAGYGFIHSFEDGYRKSDDKLILDSKWGYRAFDKFYFSAAFNFKSQFSPGFEYPSSGDKKKVSQFLAPGYFSFGIGLDYKPGKGKVLSVTFSPLTTSWVIVTDSTLRVKYGNKIDEPIRFELGAQLKISFEKEVLKQFKISSTLSLFSDYLKNPQNFQVNWDFQAAYQINKFLKSSIRTNLVYDDNILIADKSGYEAPRIQFKEVFSLSFSYTFGEFKKQK